jgi:arsenate reductase
MDEIGIDISGQRSKTVVEIGGREVDCVVTLCDGKLHEACPAFPGTSEYMHQPFDDPARYLGNEHELLAVFRRVRIELEDWIDQTFVEHLKDRSGKQ